MFCWNLQNLKVLATLQTTVIAKKKHPDRYFEITAQIDPAEAAELSAAQHAGFAERNLGASGADVRGLHWRWLST